VSLNHLKPLALALSVAAAFAPAFAQAAPPVVLDESKLLQTPRFDAKDLDPKAPVCQDLNAYVNGRWMASTPIPADKTSWGNFNMLGDRSLGVQQQLVEGLAKQKNAIGSNAQKIGDVYSDGLDMAARDRAGIAPLKPQLARIDAIKDSAGVVNYLIDSFGRGDQYVFGFGPESDFQDPNMVAGYAVESGLSLPERAYYLEDKYKPIREAFVAHVERMLGFAGVAPADAQEAGRSRARLRNRAWRLPR
jgi:putative endopeptidase